MTILRDYERTESDDFKLNVLPSLSETTEVTEIRIDLGINSTSTLVGWKIKGRYE